MTKLPFAFPFGYIIQSVILRSCYIIWTGIFMFMSLSSLFEAGIVCDNEAHINASDVPVCDIQEQWTVTRSCTLMW